MSDTKPDQTDAPVDGKYTANSKKLFRLPKQGKIAGVCAGLADYLNMDVTIMRLIFVVLTIASGGFGLLVYLALALIMPTNETQTADLKSVEGVGKNFNQLTTEIQENGGADRVRNYLGVGLILLGSWLLFVQFFPGWAAINWGIIWPLFLVVIGLIIVAKSRN